MAKSSSVLNVDITNTPILALQKRLEIELWKWYVRTVPKRVLDTQTPRRYHHAHRANVVSLGTLVAGILRPERLKNLSRFSAESVNLLLLS